MIRRTVGADPDLAAQWHVDEQQRRTAHGALAKILADRGVLKTGLTSQDAADLTFLVVSVEGYFLATPPWAGHPNTGNERQSRF